MKKKIVILASLLALTLVFLVMNGCFQPKSRLHLTVLSTEDGNLPFHPSLGYEAVVEVRRLGSRLVLDGRPWNEQLWSLVGPSPLSGKPLVLHEPNLLVPVTADDWREAKELVVLENACYLEYQEQALILHCGSEGVVLPVGPGKSCESIDYTFARRESARAYQDNNNTMRWVMTCTGGAGSYILMVTKDGEKKK